jgi:hypothetical protein
LIYTGTQLSREAGVTPRAPNASFFAVGTAFDGAAEDIVSDLERKLRPCEPSLILFFAHPKHDFAALAGGLQRRFPDAITAGCTTMGELGPSGLTQGQAVALALGPPCRAAAVSVPDLCRFRFEDGEGLAADLASQLDLAPDGIVPGRHVLVTLTDGLSGMEEILVASLGAHLPLVPLVGGSAGDGDRFQRTLVALQGASSAGAAVVLLLEPSVRFHAFQLHHYQPTPGRVVVTRAEPKRRLVSTLNGRPAVDVLAELFGVTPAQLRAGGIAELVRHGIQFGFHVGDSYYMRSVMTLLGDSLLLGGAVEEGAILTVMRAGDIVEATRQGVLEAQRALGGQAEVMLAFSCGGRMLEARDRGVLPQLEAATGQLPCLGFTTYGEQFGSMQVNHTLTALMLGLPHGR